MMIKELNKGKMIVVVPEEVHRPLIVVSSRIPQRLKKGKKTGYCCFLWSYLEERI